MNNNILTNIEESKLINSFGGELLDGKISLESNRGYKNIPSRPQQDAILSFVKSDNCYLNVVADGAGSCSKADKASIRVIEGLKEWFESITEKELNLLIPSEIVETLEDVLININNELVIEEQGKAYSTVVLALTLKNYTLIANVGDSTAYMYKNESNKLIKLSELHSYSNGLSYEDARHDEENNIITKSIGYKLNSFTADNNFDKNISYKLVRNVGQRIMLSSDGVTDLISENSLKFFFRNNWSAKSIVSFAVNSPEVSDCIKKSDNVSAIVIDLPNEKQKVLKI